MYNWITRTPVWTYSMKKPATRLIPGVMYTERNNVFDQILQKENILNNSDSCGQTDHGKIATQRRRKKKEGKVKCQVKKTSTSTNKRDSRNNKNGATNNRSNMLFCDFGSRKVKMKSSQTQKTQLGKARKMADQNIRNKIYEAQNEDVSDFSSLSSAVSEKPEDIEGFVIEERVPKGQIMATDLISSQKKITSISKLKENRSVKTSAITTRGNLSKLQSSVCFNCEGVQWEDDDDSSIEIPRDAGQNSIHYHTSLTESPLSPLERSVEASPPDFRRMNRKPVFSADLTSARPVDSVLSCERMEMSGHSSGVESPSSEYTYSYVSTYTDGTATGTSSAKSVLNSPAVKMNLFQPLNSTTYKNKDCIGAIEFPDSISPICGQKCAKWAHQDKCIMQKITASNQVEIPQMKEKTKKHTKYSTVLFGSECSCTLDSMNLSTIYSHEKLTSESQIKITHVSNTASSRDKYEHQIPHTDNRFSSRQSGLKLNESDCSGAAHLQACRRYTNTKQTSSLLNPVQTCHPNFSSKYAVERNTQKNNVSLGNTLSKAVSLSTGSSQNVLAKKNIEAFQSRTIQNSTDNLIRATKFQNKNDTETLAEINRDKECCHNQYQGQLTLKNKENAILLKKSGQKTVSSHKTSQHTWKGQDKTRNSETFQEKLTLPNDSMAPENQNNISDEPLRPTGTKKSTLSEPDLKRRKAASVLNVCYVNRLCMAARH